MIKLIFQQELILIERVHQKNVIHVTIGILKILVLSTNHNQSNGCHDLMQNVAIIFVKGSAYRIHFSYVSKDDAFSIMTNSNLID